jgi:exonuclease III
VRGLDTQRNPEKLPALANAWNRLKLDVVLVQEHHMKGFRAATVQRLSALGWKTFWACNDDGARASAGIMIAVRKRSLEDGLTICSRDIKVWGPRDGRCASLDVDWGGHKFQIASIYMPNREEAQPFFIRNRLRPMLAAAKREGRTPLWGGDFNFTPNPSIDRLSLKRLPQPRLVRPDETEHETEQEWKRVLPEMVDLWRLRYPARRELTWFGHNGASRIDRFYAPVNKRDFCIPRGAAIPSRGGDTLSDHRLVTLDVVPCSPPVGSGARRPPCLRTHFTKDSELCDQFKAWVEAKALTMPTQPATLFKWWVKFKRRLHTRIKRLNSDFLKRKHATVEEKNGAVIDLMQEVTGPDEEMATAALAAIPAARAEAVAAIMEQEEVERVKERRDWVHRRERPNPALTGQLQG